MRTSRPEIEIAWLRSSLYMAQRENIRLHKELIRLHALMDRCRTELDFTSHVELRRAMWEETGR